MIHAAEHDRFRTTLERATLHRDGLLIVALVYRPLRSRNFHSIEIGTGLHRRGDRWFLETDASETKGGRHQEAEWPTQLAEPLDRYIAVHRPVLIACTRKNLPPTNALWISNHGTQLTTHAISFQIKSRTEAEFGKPINPHSFRHLAATTIATADPEGVLDIPALLGHASPTTGEKFYNKAKMVDAGRRYQQTLELWTGKK